MRDPKRNPIPGDIVLRWGSTRTVTAIEKNSNGTTTRVFYDGNSCSIGAWRAWTKTDATVKHAAGQAE
ncbi:hypothetical protein HZU75_04385 [Chitinibacter fontanus]|uniref:Uncharacterized protein n=1 Tax=Chitinibacter fontanus TaxID=1737446 RepID=A0A7D5ZFC3_9NEIS|nr:hypothetical protein [Chitinibacter fontanus]QLI80829.1 hypothetical protein HZU75_04385 [Chitinibacter fontanus]